MTEVEYRNSAYDMIYLVSCLVNGKAVSKERAEKINTENLYKAAKKHGMSAITAAALESAGIKAPAFIQAIGKALRRSVLFDTERKAIIADMEKAGIWYMPLKGAILKDYYPRMGLREMSDNDILYNAEKAEAVRDIMLAHGFELKEWNIRYNDVYFKPPVCNFEMHRMLYCESQEAVVYNYYRNVKDRLIKDEDNGFGYHFRKEDFYIYDCAHEYKHYTSGGTGLRSLLDRYILLKRFMPEPDMEYIKAEMEKLEMADYERSSRELAKKVFSGAELDKDERAELDYYIFSGTYGNLKNLTKNRIKDKSSGGKLKFLLGRLFLPMKTVKAVYPFFYKHKVLLPVLFFYRIFRGLTVSRKQSKEELSQLLDKDKM